MINNNEDTQNSSLVPISIDIDSLNEQSKNILNQIISEKDLDKTKDLTNLFNINQNKKTLVRVDKLSELLDAITDQTLLRFRSRPDEISNQELLQSLKTVSELIDKGQKQVAGVDQPLIQINQQNTEVNLKDESGKLSRESRERVKNAVLDIFQMLNKTKIESIPQETEIIIDNTEEDSEKFINENENAENSIDSVDTEEDEEVQDD